LRIKAIDEMQARRLQILSAHLAAGSEEKQALAEKQGRVYVIRLNRPKALNALCRQLHEDLGEALKQAQADLECGCVVITGVGRAFAAGADITEFLSIGLADNVLSEFPNAIWEQLNDFALPTIAAVNGLALGGGCELAMMCDIILASEKAIFGQPEIKLGLIPGAGGTQRLTRIVGKSKAMELCLTGDNMTAQQAKEYNLASDVFPHEELLPKAIELANRIAANSRPVTMLCKEAVKNAYETTLSTGIRFERKAFQTIFGLEDKVEGTKAFVEKRKPEWRHR
jgi:enoyl-CoA hydratase